MTTEVGIDVIETARIRGVLERHDARFLERVYTEWERHYCRHNVLHLAGRWAAKEAVSKMLGLGVRGVGGIEIKRTPLGQPTVTLHGRAEARARALGLREPLSVSISHIRDLAVAVAVGLR
ncbi:MAG: holo-ACP synthase [Chloroflexota bacterium]